MGPVLLTYSGLSRKPIFFGRLFRIKIQEDLKQSKTKQTFCIENFIFLLSRSYMLSRYRVVSEINNGVGFNEVINKPKSFPTILCVL